MLLLFDAVLVILAIEDYQKRTISNRYSIIIFILAILTIPLGFGIGLWERVTGFFAVSVPMFLITWIRPGSFGGGDIKLVSSCGAFLGWRLLLRGTVCGIYLAGIYSVLLILIKKEKKNVQFALGPFLSAGYIFSSTCLF